jgi:hypothetical protein
MEARGRHAFVLWLDEDCAGAGRTFEHRGRVEHVGSGVRARFVSGEELLRFVESALTGKLAGDTEAGR